MSLRLRAPALDELPALSGLCFRSKAVWGYGAAFMEACRDELAFSEADLDETWTIVAERDGGIVGVAQIGLEGADADLLKLFVEPDRMRSGAGRALMAWAVAKAEELGARRLLIEADPDAAPFYRRMGARDIGSAPSQSIPGRTLPLLAIVLRG